MIGKEREAEQSAQRPRTDVRQLGIHSTAPPVDISLVGPARPSQDVAGQRAADDVESQR